MPTLDEMRKAVELADTMASCDYTPTRAEIRFVAQALIHASEAGAKWRGIESAPKDGTHIDVWGTTHRNLEDGYERFANVHWNSKSGFWYKKYPRGLEADIHATHWMPLPAPPALRDPLPPQGAG